MPTAAQEEDGLEQLIEAIAAGVPETTLADVVLGQGFVSDFDLLRKSGPEDPEKRQSFLVRRVVEIYDGSGAIPTLARALYARTWQDGEFVKSIVPFMQEADPANDALQAAIALRAHTMQSYELRKFLTECEPRICVIAAEHVAKGLTTGTGFLVGPDLVLTAYHTLGDHIKDGKRRDPPPQGQLCAFFDHYDGDPITDLRSNRIKAFKVAFHDDWLVDASEVMPRDGEFDEPDEEQKQLLPERLDFALVRLAEPVGRHVLRTAAGGVRRFWFEPRVPANLALREDDRIIIPQHPFGFSQRIDFGRFSKVAADRDTSNTRIRYTTETQDGTSGAPCFTWFDKRFALVGMHNAAYRPHGIIAVANQAIRLERIIAKLRGQLASVQEHPVAVPVWNVSEDLNAPRVILGRTALLDWIERAANEQSLSRSDRVYAAVGRDEGVQSTKNFGKSFSIEILRAARRNTGEPLVVLGTKDGLIPSSAPDVIGAIADQLRIPRSALDGMPPRPETDPPAGLAGMDNSDDKLWKWASEELPRWFDGVLRQYREQRVDLVQEARERVELLRKAGVAPSQADLDLAARQEPMPNTRNRWPVAWIALDRVAEARIEDDVLHLIAGLIGGKLAEASMPQELRRLRWLFLGFVPDYLESSQVIREVLDPGAIGAEAVVSCMRCLAAGFDRELDEGMVEILQIALDAWMEVDELGAARLRDQHERLKSLQAFFPTLARKFAARIGVRT